MKWTQLPLVAEMVRETLKGGKTQTRRVVKSPVSTSQHGLSHSPMILKNGIWWLPQEICPYGRIGDKLWVREVWAVAKQYDYYSGSGMPESGRCRIWYLADGPKPEWAGRTRAARFMPRWASRITLEIMKVRVERVQEISLADINAEGTPYTLDPRQRPYGSRCEQFQRLWDSINAKRGYGWDVNPWVWVIEFRRIS